MILSHHGLRQIARNAPVSAVNDTRFSPKRRSLNFKRMSYCTEGGSVHNTSGSTLLTSSGRTNSSSSISSSSSSSSMTKSFMGFAVDVDGEPAKNCPVEVEGRDGSARPNYTSTMTISHISHVDDYQLPQPAQ